MHLLLIRGKEDHQSSRISPISFLLGKVLPDLHHHLWKAAEIAKFHPSISRGEGSPWIDLFIICAKVNSNFIEILRISREEIYLDLGEEGPDLGSRLEEGLEGGGVGFPGLEDFLESGKVGARLEGGVFLELLEPEDVGEEEES
jgi:hypothetical protein